MPKLKRSALLALVADPAVGYTGPKDDPVKARAFLSSINAHLKDGAEEVHIDKWEDEDDSKPAARKTFSIPETVRVHEAAGTTTATALPPDFDAKVEAKVQANLKALGLNIVNGRPMIGDPGAHTKVKSSEERIYEARIEAKTAQFKSFETAKLFHLWLSHKMASEKRDHDAAAKSFSKFMEMQDRVHGKAYSTTSVTQGAALVPEVFIPDLIRNVLQYGVYSQLTQVIQTNNPQVVLPRRTGGLTVYWPLENAAATQSTATYDNVTLNANTAEVLCTASMQIINDSGINFVDTTMQELALSIAQIKDQCLLIGDGSATYGSMTGFEQKYGTTATDGGYVVVGGADASAHTLAQVVAGISRVPQYARQNMKITCTPAIRSIIFDRLSYSAGGLQPQQLINGPLAFSFLGIPIIENNVMSSVIDANSTNRGAPFTAGDQIDFLIGDFTRASKFLDLLDVELAMSSERGFDTYTMWFRGVTRFRSVVHDVGSSTAAGPVVSFWQT